jgi:hypothetical protein
MNIFRMLQGVWAFDRQVTPGGTMTGRAVFEQAGHSTYDYEEQGSLTLDTGTTHDVARRYSYRLIDNEIHVYYADGVDSGKLFHVLDAADERVAQAEHLCGQDLYKSKYEFDLPYGFKIIHEVKGPKKDYLSETTFMRLDKF